MLSIPKIELQLLKTVPKSLLNGFYFVSIIFLSTIRCDSNQTNSNLANQYATKFINEEFVNFTKQSSSDYEDYDLAKALLKEEVMAVAASDDVIISKGGSEKSSILQAILANRNDDLYPDPELVAEKLWLARQNISETQELDQLSSASGESGDDVRYSDCIYPSDRGHDFIDSIMYIYHGTAAGTIRNDLGGYILVIGSVFAFAAQLLTIIVLWLKNRRLRRSNAFYPIVINFLIMLILSNFFFIIGVQASKNRIKCEMVAILLHYLHLTTALWCLIYIYIIFDVLTNECGFKLRYNYLLAYGAPAVYVMFSYAASNDTFETHKYCWMSTKKGMIFNFMIPISFLIIVTTVFGTLCIKAIIAKQREIFCESIESITAGAGPGGGGGVTANGNAGGGGLGNFGLCIYGSGVNESMYFTTQSHLQLEKCCSDAEKSYDDFRKNDCYDSKFDLGALSLADLSIQSSSDVQDFSDFKRASKFAIFFQPMFAICWFLGVVALDNIDSCIFPAIFAICFNILNWCMLVRASSICPFIHLISDDYGDNGDRTDTIITDTNNLDDTHPPIKFDTIPLLCANKTGLNVNNNHIGGGPTIIGLGLSGGSMEGDEEEGIMGILDIDTSEGTDVVVDQQTSPKTFNFPAQTPPISFLVNSETFHKSWDCNLEKSTIASDCISTIST